MHLLLEALLDLALPRSCDGCGREGRALCAACRHVLASARAGPHRPVPCPAGLPPLTAATAYDGPVRGLLLAHKERGRRALARPLGGALADAVRAHAVPPGTALVPVPSTPAAVRARGQDHALRLARTAGRLTGLPVRTVLVHTRAVADSAGLSADERARNLSGALGARGRPPSRVVLVDDLVTTGATLAEAARALEDAGAVVLGAAVVAATRRRRAE